MLRTFGLPLLIAVVVLSGLFALVAWISSPQTAYVLGFVLSSLFLMLVVLIQRPKGGGLSGAFGGAGGDSGAVFGSKVGDVLTWVTITAFVFFVLISGRLACVMQPDRETPAPPAAEAPADSSGATPAPAPAPVEDDEDLVDLGETGNTLGDSTPDEPESEPDVEPETQPGAEPESEPEMGDETDADTQGPITLRVASNGDVYVVTADADGNRYEVLDDYNAWLTELAATQSDGMVVVEGDAANYETVQGVIVAIEQAGLRAGAPSQIEPFDPDAE